MISPEKVWAYVDGLNKAWNYASNNRLKEKIVKILLDSCPGPILVYEKIPFEPNITFYGKGLSPRCLFPHGTILRPEPYYDPVSLPGIFSRRKNLFSY
jgi:hypothetical protein